MARFSQYWTAKLVFSKKFQNNVQTSETCVIATQKRKNITKRQAQQQEVTALAKVIIQ